MSRTLSLVAAESEHPMTNPGQACGAKVLHYVRLAMGLALPEFFEGWARAHERVLAAAPMAAAAVRRCVHNRQVSEVNPMLSRALARRWRILASAA